MNAEAQRLGLHDTHFSSPSGVRTRDNYSSAWDLAALTRVALRNERFRRDRAHADRPRARGGRRRTRRSYVNNNRLLEVIPGRGRRKTGYTHKAGPLPRRVRDARRLALIAVVLDSPEHVRGRDAAARLRLRARRRFELR